MYIANVDLPDGRPMGRRVHDRGAGDRPPRRSASTFEVHDDSRGSRSASRRRRPRRRRSPTSAATSRRSPPTRTRTRPSTRPRSRRRSPRTSRSSWSSRRPSSARRPVRADARPGQAGRGGPPGRDLHQRRAVPARGRRRPAPARADDANGNLQSAQPPTNGASSSSRGCSSSTRRHRPRSFEAIFSADELDAVRTRSPPHPDQLAAARGSASSSRNATAIAALGRGTRRAPATALAWCSTRWPGGNVAPFSRRSSENVIVVAVAASERRSP